MYSNNDNIKNNLAEQSYWDNSYSDYQLTDAANDNDIIKSWIKKFIPANRDGDCFEIGCFPGRYLTFMGKLGYKLNGLDLTPRVVKEFPEWLRSQGYQTGNFSQEDFFAYADTQKYDVVCSFGFIEHFKNWEVVFEKHLSLVKDGGYLVIETPNFKGLFQRWIHYFLDYTNYRRHYIPAMNPVKWAKLCRENGFEVVHHGYIGEFQFWVDEQPTGGWRKKMFEKLIQYYPRLKKLPANKKLYSPYCGIIARAPQKKPLS